MFRLRNVHVSSNMVNFFKIPNFFAYRTIPFFPINLPPVVYNFESFIASFVTELCVCEGEVIVNWKAE